MTALSKTDPLAQALAPFVRDMLLAEVRQHALAERQAKQDEIDAEISEACRAVARASDHLLSARFSGAAEASAHRSLVKATVHLSKVMHKHGRMPMGE